MEIIPGILEKDWNSLEPKIQQILPYVKTIHIDLLDGKFASNTSFLDPLPFLKYTKDVDFELHMMVEEPIQYLKSWADAGFSRFIGHVEKMSDQIEFVAQGQLLGEVYLAIDLETEVSAIKVPLEDLNGVLVMIVKAGMSGQEFQVSTLEKVKSLSEKGVEVEVDGGVTTSNILQIKKNGATRFVSTSFIFSEGNPREKLNELRALASG